MDMTDGHRNDAFENACKKAGRKLDALPRTRFMEKAKGGAQPAELNQDGIRSNYAF